MSTVKAVNVSSLDDSQYDVVIFVNDDTKNLQQDCNSIEKAICDFSSVNPNTPKEVTVLPYSHHPSKRLIYSPTKNLNGDTDDSRNIYEAAVNGIKKSIAIGCDKPLLVLGDFKSAPKDAVWAQGNYPAMNAVLGAYHALYVPIEIREAKPDRAQKATKFGVYKVEQSLLDIAFGIEEGRRVARDIGGSDPERMSAPRVEKYCQEEFKSHSNINLRVERVDGKKYPLMEAVNRAASVIERHDGRVVFLEYEGAKGSSENTNLFFVGKGITYDTGGADVKANGVMAGMHRDKCGAAAVVGLFKTLALLKPSGLSVHGLCAFVRNSIGENCYVADEIITARSGQRIRVGNTDAEGRMVMSDLLCEAKERALSVSDPFIFTVATLTGHVVRAYKDYAAVMDNGPARQKSVSKLLQEAGDKISDIAEISTVRRDDFEAHKGPSEYEDVLQCNNLPSSATPRGHQTPAAFMTMASGLHKHGRDSQQPLPYTHMDVAGSATSIYTMPSASPLMMLAARYVIPKLK